MSSPYFTSEHELFRSSVKDFFAKEAKPSLDRWESERKIPSEIWKKMAEMEYLGLAYNEEYGGLNLDWFYSVVFIEELSKLLNGGFATAVCVHSYMATNHISRAGSKALKQKYLTPAIKGEIIGALAMTEPHVGSNVQGLKTIAKRDGNHFIVNGSKTFITNGCYGHFYTTLLNTEKGLTILVIDSNSTGIQTKKLNKIGWHSSDTAEIFFENVRVPVENIVGIEGQGFYYIADSLQTERMVGAIMAIGAMDEVINITIKYMHEREAFGKPISKFQTLRHQIADLATELEAARQLAYHTVWKVQNGEFAVKECSMSKLYASELQKKLVDCCLQMFGGYGYVEDFPIARAFRDARAGTIAGGTSEIMKEIIAKMTFDDIQYNKAYVNK